MKNRITPKTYENLLPYLESLPAVGEWAELHALIERTTRAKVRHWQLPAFACQSVGGSPTQSLPATAALLACYLAIVLVDDMIDADPKGYHIQHGCPATSHLAGALQAIGLEAIARAQTTLGSDDDIFGDTDIRVKAAVINKLNQMMLSVALGQYWDTHSAQDEESYWRIVQTKSAPFFGATFYVGAMMGGATEEEALKLEQIGGIYGELIQLHDDLHDVMQTPADPDWTQGRSPLPILFAAKVSHPQQARFQELLLRLRSHMDDTTALAEAQMILIHSGAVSYVIDQLLQRHQQAATLLGEMNLADRDAIGSLLNDVIQPAYALLEMAAA